MASRYVTLDDLLEFCRTNNFTQFSAAQHGAPLVVHSFEKLQIETDSAQKGLLPVRLESCHIGKNLNKSAISEESMNAHKASFKGRPILGAIIQLDSGEYDFHGHDMHLEYNGDDAEIIYDEIPVGIVSELTEPELEYNEAEGKTYLVVKGHIFEDYSRAAEILQRKQTCACSVEIAVEEMSYNVKEDCLNIESFYFTGVTILGSEPDGTPVAPGMAGSNITIDTFSHNDNSVYKSKMEYDQLLIDTLEKLNATIQTLSYTNSEEGGNDMDNEEIVVDEVEVVEAFVEDVDEPQEGVEVPVEPEDTVVVEDENFALKCARSTTDTGSLSVVFEISHADIRTGLYNLLSEYESADNEWYFITDVYDTYFVFENWDGNVLYRQSYVKDDDTIAFDGDRQRVYKMILTESEKTALEEMRTQYAVLQAQYNELAEFKKRYDADVDAAERAAVFEDAAYRSLTDNAEFNELVRNSAAFSVDECREKADAILGRGMRATYSVDTAEKKPGKLNFSLKDNEEEPKAYGNLFDH